MSVKSPAFQFYAAEFLADENVVLMTNQEIGCYTKLLCYCWREESIPSNVDKIAKLCGEDGSAMAQLWLAIAPCFESAINDDSRLIHPRLEIERKKQEEYRKERSESGKKGAKAKWNKALGVDGSAKAKPMAEPMANDGSSSSSSSSSSTTSTTNVVHVGDKSPPCPHQKIIDLYHERLPDLQKVVVWNETRRRHLQSRWKEIPDLRLWGQFFEKVSKSKFLMGKTNGTGDRPPFRADLEWLIKPTNFAKVLEGKYERG